MLDRKFIVEHIEEVKANCAKRGAKADIEGLLSLETQRKLKQVEVDELNRKANEVSKSIGKAKDAAEREALKDEGRRLREQTAAEQAALDRIVAESDAVLRAIPNLSHPEAPVGGEDSSREIRKGKHAPRK